MGKEEKKRFIVTSKSPRWSFLNGYSCNSIDRDHFIRHLGYKFKGQCTMYQLNNARLSGDIKLDIYKDKEEPKRNYYTRILASACQPSIENEYWDDYGYVVEYSRGVQVYKKTFVSDKEANEWINGEKG